MIKSTTILAINLKTQTLFNTQLTMLSMRKPVITFLLTIATTISYSILNPIHAASPEVERVKRAAVKIHATINRPDYFTPWSMLNSKQTSGSGSIISGKETKRILTNAHVVADASFIQVQRHADPKKYQAKVAFISHETDLAILTVDDQDFFKDSITLPIGKLPDTQESVHVFGFPQGGTTLSVTKGVLSRVEHQSFAHGDGYFLAGQIDAAINPGNSGGPVIINQKIVGVVMQANFGSSSENQGYFVPPSVINHVLEDIEDGNYDGFRSLGFDAQTMESPSLRKYYGLSNKQTGVIVTYIAEGSPAKDLLMPNDVILKIGKYDIADDSTIVFRDDQRTHYKYALDQYHFDEVVPITIVRDGKEQTIKLNGISSIENSSLVRNQAFDELPDYYIYGGVVFVPLNMNLIQRWGTNWHKKAPLSLLKQRYENPSLERTESVVAINVLPAEVNLGFHDWSNWVIDTVNDEKIKNFDHLVKLLDKHSEPFMRIGDEDGYQMILDHQQAIDSRDMVLQRYRVPNYHSKSVSKILSK